MGNANGDDNAEDDLTLPARVQQNHETPISTIAEDSIARDLEFDSAAEDSPAGGQQVLTEHSLATNVHRPSFVGGLRPVFGIQASEARAATEQEREDALRDERSLLRDNQIIPPKHVRSRSVASHASRQSGTHLRSKVSTTGFLAHGESLDEGAIEEDDQPAEPTETTALLGLRDPEAPYGGEADPESINQKWEEAVMSGRIKTSWQREAKVLLRYSAPGVVTFLLQNSLTITSIFTVGHIGKVELGAVSLGGMTANITGYALFHGLTTSLDTLCSQAYGSGKKQLVGLQLQRMVFFLWLICIPISIVWIFGSQILAAIIPEKEIAELAGQYLKVLVLGAPAYALFESSKRFVQAQGRFEATTYVLMICAPLNIFMHWLFVWAS